MSNFNHPNFLHNSNPRSSTIESKYNNRDRRNSFSFNNRIFNKKFFFIVALSSTIIATLNYVFLSFFSFGAVASSIIVFVNILIANVYLSIKLTGPLQRVAQCFNHLQSGSNENVHLRKNDFYQEIVMEYNKYVNDKRYLDKNKIININTNRSKKYTTKRKSA
jgi:hypothetical protein